MEYCSGMVVAERFSTLYSSIIGAIPLRLRRKVSGRRSRTDGGGSLQTATQPKSNKSGCD